MALTRRKILATTAKAVCLAAAERLGFAQFVLAPEPELEFGPVLPPSTAAAKALFADVGAAAYTELEDKLRIVNADIVANGLRHLPGLNDTFLTGYPKNEFYDWDCTSRTCICRTTVSGRYASRI